MALVAVVLSTVYTSSESLPQVGIVNSNKVNTHEHTLT